MSRIVCTTSVKSVGATFVNWSIHFLAGDDSFFSTDHNCWLNLVNNPINVLNSHLHLRNHPSGYNSTVETIEKLKETPLHKNEFHSIYASMLSIEKIAELGVATNNDFFEYAAKDYKKIWALCDDRNIDLIFIEHTRNPLYLQYERNTKETVVEEDKVSEFQDQIKQNFLLQFYGDKKFDNVWDLREFIALSVYPFEVLPTNDCADFTKPHLHIDSMDLFINGVNVMRDIFEYLRLPIIEDRLDKWLEVYHEWQQIQADFLRLDHNIEHICKCIVNGFSHNLKPYKLTLWQEAIIQHHIIHKYNLNFKSWNLEKFPDNTAELFNLLEPNMHTLNSASNRY